MLLATNARAPARGAHSLLHSLLTFRLSVPALQWAGPATRSKYEHIIDDLMLNCNEQWSEGNDLHIDTLDVYLLECLEADFNVEFEDDAVVTEVSAVIQELYRQCMAGQLGKARELIASLDTHRVLGNNAVSGGTGGAGAGEGGAASKPRKERVVDEDGWETVVTHKKGKASGGAGGGAGGAGAGARHDEEEEEHSDSDDDEDDSGSED